MRKEMKLSLLASFIYTFTWCAQFPIQWDDERCCVFGHCDFFIYFISGPTGSFYKKFIHSEEVLGTRKRN